MLKVFPSHVDKRTVERELAKLAPLRGQPSILVADTVEETEDGHVALRVEQCVGNLRDRVPLGLDDAVRLGIALATALATAHRNGVVHGGVTPGNVLFRTSGETVLSDFGPVLRQAFPRDLTREVNFLPPETLRDGTTDERTDLYGLGAVLHLALTGRSPHEGPANEGPDDRMLRVLSTPVPPLDRPDLPARLTDLVSALLSMDPRTRPSAHAVATGLAGLLPQAAGSFDDFPPSAPEPTRTPRPRRTGLVLGGVAGVAVLAAAFVVLRLEKPAPAAPPPTTSTAAAPGQQAVQLELDDPVDKGKSVELTWRSSDELDFAVIVATEGQQQDPVFTQRNRTAVIPVDPLRPYCFQIQGTNRLQVWESQPKPIRGAVCKL
jgi:eukaryotic-like serine/threonine-protein kinase